jgi:hypothetical protein
MAAHSALARHSGSRGDLVIQACFGARPVAKLSDWRILGKRVTVVNRVLIQGLPQLFLASINRFQFPPQ